MCNIKQIEIEKINFSFCHFNANALQQNQIKETENEKISWYKTSDKKQQQEACNVITYYIQTVHWITREIKSHIRAPNVSSQSSSEQRCNKK